jgi:gentisate 1,2-dioxygenase
VLAALTLMTACQKPPSPPKPEPQKPAPPPVSLSSYTPQRPYKQYSPGLLAQTAYVAPNTGRHAVEIWDLMVGPGKKSEPATLPGAAVFEVRSGAGIITAAGRRREVKSGATLAVNEGESFAIENRTPDGALMIRATVIRALK